MLVYRSRLALFVGALGLLFLPLSAFAQARGTVTGLVRDESSGQPLIGAQILVAGTQLGGLTDQRGRFIIPGVPPGRHSIIATIIGYTQRTESIEVTAGATATVDFGLKESAVPLSGIVVNAVTGQEERRRELGNSMGRIDVAALEKAVIARPADLLTARVPGVEVRNTNGTTGTGQKIRIRGANSISLDNEPLIIIDGIRFDNSTTFMDAGFSEGAPDQVPNRFNDLNPDDIETIEILKGPAASGMYGTAASNGVILITTKRGHGGPTRWNFFAEGGSVQERTKYPDNIAALRRNANGTFTHCRNYQVAAGACTQDTIAIFNTFEDDAFSPFRDGARQKYGLSAAGGNEGLTFFLSGDFDREKGVYESNEVKKVNLRANMRAGVRENLVLNISTGYTTSFFSQPSNDNSVLSPILNSMFGRARFDHATPARAYYLFAPEVTAKQYFATQDIERFVGSGTANWQPFSWLSVNATAGLDVFSLEDAQLTLPGVAPIAATWINGWAEESRGTNYNYTANSAAVARFALTPSIVSTTTLGADYNKSRHGATRGKGFNLTPGANSLDGTSSLFQIDSDNTEVITLGGFAQQQFAFSDRVFVGVGLRADDNSAFGQDFGLVYYPSLTGSWVVSEESFFPETNAVSSLRLRGAVGQSGQRPQFRQAETYFSPAAAATETGDAPGLTVGGTGNLDLKPERTREVEGGFDVGLLSDRLAAELTYFHRKTSDALIARVLPPSVGQTNPATLSGTRFENIGSVRNSGFEAAINARVIDNSTVGFNLRIAAATLDNEIVQLGEDIDPILLNRGKQRHITGYTAGGYWQPRLVFSDDNNDGLLALEEYSVEDSLSFIGPSLPKYSGSITTEIRLFDFLRVTSLIEGRAGHYQLNDNEEFRCFFSLVTSDRGCNGLDNPEASIEEQAAGMGASFGDPNTGAVTHWGLIEKADFLKWRELAVTFTPPAAWTRMLPTRNVSLTLAGRNLRTWTKYSGLDPEANETGSGSNFTQGEFGSQPQVRYWIARINFNF